MAIHGLTPARPDVGGLGWCRAPTSCCKAVVRHRCGVRWIAWDEWRAFLVEVDWDLQGFGDVVLNLARQIGRKARQRAYEPVEVDARMVPKQRRRMVVVWLSGKLHVSDVGLVVVLDWRRR